jgi:integrase
LASIVKRPLKSGGCSYDVRYRIDGEPRMKSFRRRKDADAFATTIEAQRLRGVVIDPRRALVTVKDYGDQWLQQRHDLAVRTAELYGWLFEKQVVPTLGKMRLADLTPRTVRAWNATLAKNHASTAAKAYRLLSQMMRTAVADEVLSRNPCQVKGAASERAAERPTASIAEVEALAAAMPAHLRVAVLLAAWCQLRRAEILGLRRRDVNLLRGVVTVELTRGSTMAGNSIVKEPKTDAGRRTVAFPSNIKAALEDHLERYVGAAPNSLVIVGKKGGPLQPHVLGTAWIAARTKVGRSDLHLHDLRHSGLTWSAAAGATVAELMHRAGHASPAAALRYQHATEDRDRALADALAHLATVQEIDPRDGRAIEGDEGSNPVVRIGSSPGGSQRAGDGNRTRVLSLGS